MTDIVIRLREAEGYGQFGRSLLHSQVADEIERLRSELAESDRNVISQMVIESDIANRLRDAERYGQFGRSLLYDKVADEIERLRSEIGTSGSIDEDPNVKPHNHLVNPPDCADEVEYWRLEATKLAKLLMSEYVFVHERLIEELDEVLKPYLGGIDG
jgi:hypothetical protein